MHAVNSIKDDLEVRIEKKADYEIHRFFYKGLQIGKVYWRPTATYKQGRCDFCGSLRCGICFLNMYSVTDENRLGSSAVELKIQSYCKKLFNREDPPFQCIDFGSELLLYLDNILILRTPKTRFKWSFDIGTHPDIHIEIHDDRVEIKNRTEFKKDDPLIFYKAIPFHREILTELRKFEPFSKAPVWLK